MTTLTELENCPFCGGKVRCVDSHKPWICCDKCETGFSYKRHYSQAHNMDFVVNWWNKRAIPPNALRVIAECKETLARYSNTMGSDSVQGYGARQALALIAAFEQDVTQQEKM